jgi:hypothetical protein
VIGAILVSWFDGLCVLDRFCHHGVPSCVRRAPSEDPR